MNRPSTKKAKVISCFGNVNQKSAAIMCGVSQAWVCVIWAEAGLLYTRRNTHSKRFLKNNSTF